MELVDGDTARKMEPALADSIAGALYSPSTGIVDSHALMASFERDIEDAGGALAYATRAVRVDPSSTSHEGGWVVQTITGAMIDNTDENTTTDSILARTLINAAGHAASTILNALLPPPQRLASFFARGSYASYRGPGTAGISHLIYPCPTPPTRQGADATAFHSLGTHLTLDLAGNVRFGPDLEWLSPPFANTVNAEGEGEGEGEGEADETDVDFWTHHLTPDSARLASMHSAITSYLPFVTLDGLQPDYVGVRPKLVGPGGGFQDFILRTDLSTNFLSGGVKARRGAPMVSLLGIESPGLTASMAIAEVVVEDVLVGKGLHVREG